MTNKSEVMNGLRGIAISGLLACTMQLSWAGVEIPLRPFSTDGCSLFPDRAVDGSADWCQCCLAHDLAYWRGGTADERFAADQAFRGCVLQASGSKVLAELMYAGVRAGGGPGASTSFRWAYGWPSGRHYTPLSGAERVIAVRLERDYRAGNPALQCRK